MNFGLSFIQVSDISHHQGYPPNFRVVDFEKMKLWGMLGCIMRASHGSIQDNAFTYNWPACKPVLPRSSYHYYENYIEPKRQAEKYWSMIEHDNTGMMWLDLEDPYLGAYYHWDYWYQWLERLKTLSGATYDDVGIYSGRAYIIESFRTMPTATRAYFKQYKFWLADYGAKGSNPLLPDFSTKQVPYPYTDNDVLLVQTGTPVIGIACGVYSYEIDYNRVRGYDSFNRIFKTSINEKVLDISIRRLP